jgi:hypothetical protein
MKKILTGILVANCMLFANSTTLDEKVTRTYEYMSNTATFHYNGKVLRFPEYGVSTNCIDARLLKPETIKTADALIKKFPNQYSKNGTCNANGYKGYVSATIVGTPHSNKGEYVFDMLKKR